MLGLLLVVSALKVCFSDISCLFQALQNRNLDSAFTIILWAQLFAYILLDLPKVLETGGQELVSAVVYFALCSVPAWAGFRSRGGEHAVHRSYALMLSNVALSLLMVLWGFDMVIAPTSFMRVGVEGMCGRGKEVGLARVGGRWEMLPRSLI